MATRSCPWQYEWKRPQWQSPVDATGEQKDLSLGVPLCLSSAEVSLDEFGDSSSSQRNDYTESFSLVLTVSLLSSQTAHVGDVLLLELIQQNANGMKRIRSRVLQWPGSALGSFKGDKEANTSETENKQWYQHLLPWKGADKKDGERDQGMNGLVSIALCRRPPQESSKATAVDALDVVTMMSLGLVSSAPEATNKKHEQAMEESNENADLSTTSSSMNLDETSGRTELVLTCLTANGRVHFYSAPRLFESRNAFSDKDEMSGSLASLFMGDAIYNRINQSILPLSQPFATVALSVPIRHYPSKGVSSDKTTSAAMMEEPQQTEQNDMPEMEEESKEDAIGWWDGSLWDANVEPSTAIYRTRDNTPTLCVAAFDYVAVGGKGVRRRRKRRKIHKKEKPKAGHHRADNPPQAPLPDTNVEKEKPSTASDWWADTGDSQPDPEKQDASATDWAHEDITDTAPQETNPFERDSFEIDEGSKGAEPLSTKSTNWIEYGESGGFVTFLSLRHYAESRTVYLPFAPKKLSPIVWGGMCFLIVLGSDYSGRRDSSPLAMAIRVDASDIMAMPCGEAPSVSALLETLHDGARTDDKLEADTSSERGEGKIPKRKQLCSVRRFQLLPIALPSIQEESSFSSISASPIAVSSLFTTPPFIAVLYSSLSSEAGGKDAVVALHSFDSIDLVASASFSSYYHRGFGRYRNQYGHLVLTIQTNHQSGHLARLPCHIESEKSLSSLWCHIGQGWTLIGVEKHVYFACWEGSTESEGAYVTEIHSDTRELSNVTAPYSSILPIYPFVSVGRGDTEHAKVHPVNLEKSVKLNLPFTSQYDTGLETRYTGEDNKLLLYSEDDSVVEVGNAIDDIVVDALESISSLNYRDAEALSSQPPTTGRRKESLSHREKSQRLYRHCSSWAQLDDSDENRAMLDGQVPVLIVRLGSELSQNFVLTLRKIFTENGAATPFNQILAWLCQGKEYFTASSVALDLLGDVDALRDLRRMQDHVEEADERVKLEGILDGIVPLDFGNDKVSQAQQISRRAWSTLTQLADMTVGCLVKGGLSMSTTLEGFLSRNENYDPARASLMLCATAACSVSGDEDIVRSVMGRDYEESISEMEESTRLLWPVRCLLQVAISRDYLPTALLLLNEAIPDELRRRPRAFSLESATRPPLELCISLVKMIVASSADAATLLLDLVDDESRKRYWSSLGYDTQSTLALIEIDGKCPLLRETEVRMWALKHVHHCIETQGSTGSVPEPSDAFLKHLCTSCLNNAGCHVEGLFSETSFLGEDGDGGQRHLQELRMTQNALAAAPGSGGLDFDLFIAALLLLEQRGVMWREKACVSTQDILDAACYLAGRKSVEEPVFLFDGSTVMKECALSGNVSAGANLIGGKDGLVLKCCDVLIQGAGMNMDDAEAFLLKEELSRDAFKTRSAVSRKDNDPQFTLTDGHRHVLWLFDEQVLSLKTFGEFETVHVRGRVDPVFAARSCFRTWLCLDNTNSATAWLVSWLRERLGIDIDTVSGKRLACAAILRALVWPEDDDNDMDADSDQLLANALGIEGLFLVQLSQACCGLIESIPSSLAKNILRNAQSSVDGAYASAPLQVDV